ncbi:MAG: PIN domain-containing protein [Bifidobacteriaceae bacterium]|jgi:predicted nucleic acid-binding protein|nr:PIN domain-containing protein [Bifidobacteriaceae bacterium]
MTRVLLDTSVVIALVKPSEATPDLTDFDGVAVSCLTWSELAAGLHSAPNVESMSRRLDEYDRLRTLLNQTIPYDESCVAAYRQLLARVATTGGTARSRPLDRMIAATALAAGLPLVTRDLADSRRFQGLLEIFER